MQTPEVYIYGMTVWSTIHLLNGPYPAVDTYQEIRQSYQMPGGEAGNCAVVLNNLGMRVALDGCHLGSQTVDGITTSMEKLGIDCSRMTRLEDFEGWRDLVLCDGASRTVFGWFARNFSAPRRLWTQPDESAIRAARCVALDPFFQAESEQAAAWCKQYGTPYVTIDCKWDTFIAQHAAALVVSNEFIHNEYPSADIPTLMEQYRAHCAGWVIFTFGAGDVLFTLPGQSTIQRFTPYKVDVVDTLGAGDTFRAGIVYGLLKKMDILESVRFASALAGVACTRFPSVLVPPSLEEVEAMIGLQE